MDTRPKTRRRSASVTVGVTVVLVTTLSGCSASAEEEEYEYGAICADQQTQQRVDDDDCDESPSYGWYYIPVGATAPAIGETASGGVFSPTPDDESVCYGGVPREGGEVTQGGFGACSGSFGG